MGNEAPMTGPTEPRLGLYYPFINFRSDAWLKLAALYWDKVGRIVPLGHVTHDSDAVQRLQGELGFVADLPPPFAAMRAVGDEFTELIDTHGHELAGIYGVHGLAYPRSARVDEQSWPQSWSNFGSSLIPAPQWRGSVNPSLLPDADPRLAYIYSDGKMTRALERALLDSGLGVAVPGHRLIGLHPQLAFVYMHVLASRMASSAMSPLTDDDFDHVAAGCSAGRIADALLGLPSPEQTDSGETAEPTVEFAMLSIQSVIPKDIGSIPVDKIIALRRECAEELARFQQATKEIVASMPEVLASADAQVCALYLQSLQEKTLKPELRQLKDSLDRAGVDGVLGSISVKVEAPQLVTSGAALLGIGALHLNPIMVGAGAIALCLVPRIRRQKAQAQRIRADSPAAYLLRLEENLNPASLAEKVRVRAKQFLKQ
jgi:hypothetical protein